MLTSNIIKTVGLNNVTLGTVYDVIYSPNAKQGDLPIVF